MSPANTGIALLIVFIAGLAIGYDYADRVWNERWLSHNMDGSEQARQEEHRQVSGMAKVDANHQKEQVDGKNETERLAHLAESGSVLMLERFTCPRAGDASAGTGLDNGTTTHGLRGEDAGFLIRYAGDCRATATRLLACQDALKVYQGAK